MINTYNNSLPPLPPPPVPPRARPRGPAPEPKGSGRHLRILTAVFLLHLLVTSGLFAYFFGRSSRAAHSEDLLSYSDAKTLKRLQKCSKEATDQQSVLECLKANSPVSQDEGKVEPRVGTVPIFEVSAAAHMRVKEQSQDAGSKTLQWNREYSFMRNVKLMSKPCSLQILLSGYYYVYSQVTFSKEHPKIPLAHFVLRWTVSSGRTEENLLLKAFCTKSQEPCTSFQGGIFRLEKGQMLGVNVTDPSLVHFDGAATTFGLFHLQEVPLQDL